MANKEMGAHFIINTCKVLPSPRILNLESCKIFIFCDDGKALPSPGMKHQWYVGTRRRLSSSSSPALCSHMRCLKGAELGRSGRIVKSTAKSTALPEGNPASLRVTKNRSVTAPQRKGARKFYQGQATHTFPASSFFFGTNQTILDETFYLKR